MYACSDQISATLVKRYDNFLRHMYFTIASISTYHIKETSAIKGFLTINLPSVRLTLYYVL